MQLNKGLQIFLVGLILILGFVVRLYRFGNPIADWHSWRQADTSAVSRNFVNNGFDLLHPRFDDLSNVASGLDNPQGYRFVEFPIYNVFQAGSFLLFGVLTLEEWGRIITILASCLSILFIYLIVKKHSDNLSALIASFFFAFLPFSIYYGRTILPDESMVAAILGGIYFFDVWLDSKLKIYDFRFIFSLIFTAAAFLLKPYALFFAIPIVYLAFDKFKFSAFKKWYLWLFLILSVIPLVLWRVWMTQYPEGIPASAWLFNGGNIRFTGAFFYWIFADRMGRLILGFWGLFIFGLGFLKKLSKKDLWFFLSFLFSSLVYVFVIARGNVQHDYYQILIIPTLSIYLGLGGSYLILRKDSSRIISSILFAVSVIFCLSFGWYYVRDYFNIDNNSIIVAGQAVDSITSKDAKVIANYNGDTSFLYQTKRKGWASFEKPLPEMVQMGADYLVLVNPTTQDLGISKDYKVIALTKDYVIFDLHQQQ